MVAVHGITYLRQEMRFYKVSHKQKNMLKKIKRQVTDRKHFQGIYPTKNLHLGYIKYSQNMTVK